MIDATSLREAYVALGDQVSEPYQLVGVTFSGPGGRGEWVASLHRTDDDSWCEGWGDTPMDALDDLRSHMRTEHPEVFGNLS